jgi:sirohydrochlorin cobaltochelatase
MLPRFRHLSILAALPLLALILFHGPLRAAEDDFGLLVMAHGGSPEWNASVHAAVAPLSEAFRVEVAFGMADADSLQEAVATLEARGARRIGVVRLFIDGASFRQRTEEILGLRPGAAPREDDFQPPAHSMATYRIASTASFAVVPDGLNVAPEVDRVILDRARALSESPESETLVLIAHGAGDPASNARLEALMVDRARLAEQELSFRRVVALTLAEDWEALRAVQERAIRATVAAASDGDGTAIVVPFRLSGFGPYHDVLAGLDFHADGTGLLPHPAIGAWLRRQVDELAEASFRYPDHPE